LALQAGDEAAPAAAAPPQSQAPSSLTLTCEGAHAATATAHTNAAVFGSRGSAFGSANTSVPIEKDAEVLVEIDDTGGRIHLPKSMIPPINSGGADGWWRLTDVQIRDTEIIGKLSINFLNKPSIRIDRVTGSMEMSGLNRENFQGRCAQVDRTQRLF
jgi:hypothetical protein